MSPATRRAAVKEMTMAKLKAKKRGKLPKKAFALPGRRAYPVDTPARAAAAKARATQQYNKGKISKSTRDKIHAKANKKLSKKKT
jgi:hypothetical protein